MTIINKSLAYSGETLIYINECELFWPGYIDPNNPLDLPQNTVRVRTNDGLVPYKSSEYPTTYETATLVEGTSDIYDVYKSGTDFKFLFCDSRNIVEVLGANTAGITNMYNMFSHCTSLTTVHLFDTFSVTDMQQMFYKCDQLTSVPLFYTSNVTAMLYMFGYCNSLTSVPLFDTSSVTNMDAMFDTCSSLTSVPLFNTSSVVSMHDMFLNCKKVQSGALALYLQASTQTNPPSGHRKTFRNCGSNTTTGAAELAQIPDDWK